MKHHSLNKSQVEFFKSCQPVLDLSPVSKVDALLQKEGSNLTEVFGGLDTICKCSQVRDVHLIASNTGISIRAVVIGLGG